MKKRGEHEYSLEEKEGVLFILHILKEEGKITNEEYQRMEEKIIRGEGE